MEDIKGLDLGTLLQLYAFVSADANRTFGVNQKGKLIVKAKLAAVEAEVHERIYGCNPFASVTVEGRAPEDVDLSKFDTKSEDEEEEPKTFVVDKPQE